MKTEAKKKTRLSTVPEAALEEAGLAKETICLAAIPMDGAVLVTKDSIRKPCSERRAAADGSISDANKGRRHAAD